MEESDLNDTRGPSGNQLELQPFQNLGLGDTIDSGDNPFELQPFQHLRLGDTIDPSDNQLALQPFQNLGSGQLDIVRELGRQGASVQLHFHQNNDNSTVFKGDFVQGSKTDVKDSAIETLMLPTGDSSNQGHLQSQALLEPLIQHALPWADGEERETEGQQQRAQLLSGQQSHSQDQRERFLAIEEGDQEMMMEDIEGTPETISSPRMQMSAKRDHGLQTIASITFEEESQTDEIKYRDKLSQTNEKSRFDTEAQTDNPRTRDRKLQTDEYVMESDSQTFSMISQRSNAYAQTVNKVSSDTDVQTEILEQSTNQTQTEIKSYQENEFQTDKVETLDVNSQTNEQSLIDIHPAILHGLVVAPSLISALKMIELYKNEKTKQDVGNLLPLLETTWKSIQVKIMMKSIENQLVPGREIQLKEQNLSAFISRVDEVYEIGEKYATENNFIHAVISFFAAANLERIANKNNSSVIGIFNCLAQVRLVVNKMAKQPGVKVIVIDHVIPLIHEMKDNIRFISSSSRDIKVVNETVCLCYIGRCYFDCDEHQQCANMNEYAIELLKKHFNDKAAKYSVYGSCLNNAGVAYECLGEIEKSIEKYKMSLKAKGEANDWSSDEDKTDSIAATENNLKIAEAKLRK